MKIYKYCSIDNYLYENIKNANFVYSRPSNFNDPFELRPIVKFDGDDWHKENVFTNSNEINKLINLCRDFNDPNHMNGSHLIKRIFVACFSKTYDNTLMWSYYSDGHRGICYEFDIPDEIYNSMGFKDVIYVHTRPEINIKLVNPLKRNESDNSAINKESNDFSQLVTFKSIVWSHEKEVRVYYNDKDSNYNDNLPDLYLDFISKIFIGVNITMDDQLKVAKYAKEKNIPVYKMEVDLKSFSLIPRLV